MSLPPSCSPTEAWPPDYSAVWARRQKKLAHLRDHPDLIQGAKGYYSENPVAFVNDWGTTYDPRVAATDRPAKMPFILFDRQRELIEFLHAMVKGQEPGLVEKARDMGATWVCCAFSVWLLLYFPGAAIGWGSRKMELVDKLDNPDSIFEKMRMMIDALPRDLLPEGFSRKTNCSFMRIVNPENGASITGESGDNIGRGGRKLIYFKDESAHYEHPESIEAALADNTNVQIDISSVKGIGNVFHRRRESGIEWAPGEPAHKGVVNVFVMDWREHPDKTEAWYEDRRLKAEAIGLSHVFAQEVDRDYGASVVGTIIPAQWVTSAIDAHLALDWPEPTGATTAGLDVADEGGDLNAHAARKGYLLLACTDWGDGDTGSTARRGIERSEPFAPVEINYDSVGVGAGVKSEANRLEREGLLPEGITFQSWSAGAKPQHPDLHIEPDDFESPLNKDFYSNLKAQGGWQLRRRFELTYRAITEGIEVDPDDCISLPSDMPGLQTIRKELSQPTAGRSTGTLKLLINKKPDGTKSPNRYDAIVMAYWPIVGFETGSVPFNL